MCWICKATRRRVKNIIPKVKIYKYFVITGKIWTEFDFQIGAGGDLRYKSPLVKKFVNLLGFLREKIQKNFRPKFFHTKNWKSPLENLLRHWFWDSSPDERKFQLLLNCYQIRLDLLLQNHFIHNNRFNSFNYVHNWWCYWN